MATLACLLVSLLFLPARPHSPGDENDLIVLADGKKQACRVLLETDSRIVYRVKNKTSEVPRGDVKEIQSAERSLRAYLERFAKIDTHDVKALAELALFAESSDLPG